MFKSRWLDWLPSPPTTEVREEAELPKPPKMVVETLQDTSVSFGGALEATVPIIDASEPVAEALAFTLAWSYWKSDRCVVRERSWGGIGSLQLDFARWCLEKGHPTLVSRSVFERLFLLHDFSLQDAFVTGLIFKEDLLLCEVPKRSNRSQWRQGGPNGATTKRSH